MNGEIENHKKKPKTNIRFVIYNDFTLLRKSENDPMVDTHIMEQMGLAKIETSQVRKNECFCQE